MPKASIEITSTITCPECDRATEVEMPTESCQFFWDCPSCGATVRARSGDCCVFCSYGRVPCPPVQRNGDDAVCCS